MGCTGLDLNVQAPSTVTKLAAFSFLPRGISKEEGNWAKQLNRFNAHFLSYLSAVETMICRLMYKTKVKLQMYVQNGTYKLRRLTFLYCKNMYVHDAQCNLTLVTSVSDSKPNAESGSKVQC